MVGLRICFGGGQPDRVADEFIVRWERKRTIKHDVQVFDLISCLESVAIYCYREDLGWSRFVGECQSLCFDRAEF